MPPFLEHVVAADASTTAIQSLSEVCALLRSAGVAQRCRVVRAARLSAPPDQRPETDYVRNAIRALASRHAFESAAPAQVGWCWSASALRAEFQAYWPTAAMPRLIVSGELVHNDDGAALIGRSAESWSPEELRYVCEQPSTVAALRRLRAPAPACTSLPRLIPLPARPGMARLAALRQELELDRSQRIVLLLPPISESSGAFIAAWGTLVVQKLIPAVRLVAPGIAAATSRIMRLAMAARQDSFVRFTGEDVALADLLALADVAVLCAETPTPVRSAIAAALAGTPLLVSATVAADLPAGVGEHAWTCAAQPRLIAEQLAQMLQGSSATQRRAALAQAAAEEAVSLDRARAQWLDFVGGLFTAASPA